jgi:NAD-dependent SIR2 family protein deacetylase
MRQPSWRSNAGLLRHFCLAGAGVSATVAIALFRAQPSSIGEEKESGFVLTITGTRQRRMLIQSFFIDQ